MNNAVGYEQVKKICRSIANLDHLGAIVGWDEAVMMPTGGAEERAEAMAELAGLRNKLVRSHEFLQALKAAEQETSHLDKIAQANLHEAQQLYNREVALDPDLVTQLSKATLQCQQLWRVLRAENNWQDFAKPFTHLVSLVREEAKQRASYSGKKPYDALLEIYERAFDTKALTALFSDLKKQIPPIVDEAVEKFKQKPIYKLQRNIPVHDQRQLVPQLATWLGFDFAHGRLDESHHPFCGGVAADVRMTTRYSETNFISAMMGVVHETGHARYEQGLPKQWSGMPIGLARSMAIHESQSLFYEMQIGCSREFFNFTTPIWHKALAKPEDDARFWRAENLHRMVTNVQPGYIRVDADEVTYPLHIILRFELEKALIEGEIEVADLPSLWNEKMQTYLQLSTLGNDRDGCMQDVHWPSGAFGYFPSYTLGAIIAAQLFDSLRRERPQVREEVQQGSFVSIGNWLSDKIWSKGSSVSSDELIRLATGESLTSKYYLEHLRARYLD